MSSGLEEKDNRNVLTLAIVCPVTTGISPGQRFRFENFLPYLKQENIVPTVYPFFDLKAWKTLFSKGRIVAKIYFVCRGFFWRIIQLPAIYRSDVVLIYREAAPVGPPLFEWIISRLLRKPVIYDFDDAIWIPQNGNKFLIALKCHWKIRHIIEWSYKVSAGNHFLQKFASNYNGSSFYIPTVVDTERQHNRLKIHHVSPITVGWTGSHSTLKYIESIFPALLQVYNKTPFKLLIISSRPPNQSFPEQEFIEWNEETEIDDLLKMDIGLMPLENDQWSNGKCGFKIIQYLSLGIPAIAQNIGVNKEIISCGKNGFLYDTEEELKFQLHTLLHSQEDRINMGRLGRSTIELKYSINSVKKDFFKLFQ